MLFYCIYPAIYLTAFIVLPRFSIQESPGAGRLNLLAEFDALSCDFTRKPVTHTEIKDSLFRSFVSPKSHLAGNMNKPPFKEESLRYSHFFVSFVLLSGIILYVLRGYKRRKKNAPNLKINSPNRGGEELKLQDLPSLSAMLEVQEFERKRISRELHDGLGNMLATLKLQLELLGTKLKSPESKMQLGYSTLLLHEACNTVRTISHNMCSGALLQYGLIGALRNLEEILTASMKYRVTFKLPCNWRSPGQETELVLYRILQELIGNIIKHANATEVSVELLQRSDGITIKVKDNGDGFDLEAVRKKDGIGLNNLELRVKGLSGTLLFDSHTGKGTTVIALIPEPID